MAAPAVLPTVRLVARLVVEDLAREVGAAKTLGTQVVVAREAAVMALEAKAQAAGAAGAAGAAKARGVVVAKATTAAAAAAEAREVAAAAMTRAEMREVHSRHSSVGSYSFARRCLLLPGRPS